MGASLDVRLCSGSQAALFVPQLWQRLTPRRRRYMVWDSGPAHGEAALRWFVAQADHALVAWMDGDILGLAWVQPLVRGARSCLLHMANVGGREPALSLGRAWLNTELPLLYDSLLAFLPVPFRHVRVLVEALDFKVVAVLPGGACLSMRGGRLVDAVLSQRELAGGHA